MKSDIEALFEDEEIGGLARFLADPDADHDERQRLLSLVFTRRAAPRSERLKAALLRSFEEFARDPDDDEKAFRTLLEEIQSGAKERGVFLDWVHDDARYARVLDGAGREHLLFVPPCGYEDTLEAGDSVIWDRQSGVIVGRYPTPSAACLSVAGEVAVLEDPLEDGKLVTALFENDVVRQLATTSDLRRRLLAGDVKQGARLLTSGGVAYGTMQDQTDSRTQRFFESGPLPDVEWADVGNPSAFLVDAITHLEQELDEASARTRRRFGLPRSAFFMLTGPTGTGKSFEADAFERRMHVEVASALNASLEEVPRRTMTMESSRILNKYLGQSDRALKRFHESMLEAAAETFTISGEEVQLPLLVRVPELDGLLRNRSGGDADDGGELAMSRLVSLFLQLFDPNSPNMRDLPILFVSETNLAGVLDAAASRRLAERTYHLGRLASREDLRAVLTAQIRNIPAEVDVIEQVASWAYAENDDTPVLELVYVGTTEVHRRYRKDFLTPGILRKSVVRAADQACQREIAGLGDGDGVTAGDLMMSIDDEVWQLAQHHITPANVSDYLDGIPEGVRVASARACERPLCTPVNAMPLWQERRAG